MSWDLIAVGDVLLDAALPLPVPGRTIHGRIELRPGGSATTAALAAARLGARAAVVGRIGADPAGRLVRDALATAGVEPLLRVDEDVPTGTFATVGPGTVADPGASLLLAPEDIPPTLEAGAVLVSGYSLLQKESEPAARAALARARARWVGVDVASAGLVTAYGAARFFDATGAASVVLANANEALALTGLEPEAAAVALSERYRVACVKLGRDGALAASEGVLLRVGVEPVDTLLAIGAGDAFAAGLLVALARNATLEDALQAGCDAAVAELRSRIRR